MPTCWNQFSVHCNLYLLVLVSLFEIFLFNLPLRLHQKCVPLRKVARFLRTFREPRRTVISSAHNENQLLLLWLASFMSVDTKCDRKVGDGIGNLLLFVLSQKTSFVSLMKNGYLTSRCKVRVEDFKVWFVVLGFQKNTNQQARRHYHLILRMRMSQTLSNSRHNFWPLPFF